MILKGLLVVVGGFLFIFSSGVPMRLISRFKPDYKREGLYWGIGIWILAFFISTFLQNLARQFLDGPGTPGAEQPTGIIGYLAGTLITTLLMQAGMIIYLRNRQKKEEDIISAGLALGFGIGLITQVFTGLILITAGAGVLLQGVGVNLTLGAIQAPMIQLIASETLFSLITALIALILFRVALLTVSAVQGFMVAKSINDKGKWFWLAIVVYTLFSWAIFAVQYAIDSASPGQVSLGITTPIISIITSIYYLAAAIIGYRWLHTQLHDERKTKKQK